MNYLATGISLPLQKRTDSFTLPNSAGIYPTRPERAPNSRFRSKKQYISVHFIAKHGIYTAGYIR